MNEPRPRFYEFGPFRVDAVRHLLLRRGVPVPLTPKAFETLLVLVQRRGQVVEKEDLLKEIWPDTFVEEGSLARNVSMLRKVLGEGPSDHQYIETVPRRGYRFVANVRELHDGITSLVVEKHTFARIATQEEEEISAADESALTYPVTRSRSLPAASHRKKLAIRAAALFVVSLLLVGFGLAFLLGRATKKTSAIHTYPLRLTNNPANDWLPAWSPRPRQDCLYEQSGWQR